MGPRVLALTWTLSVLPLVLGRFSAGNLVLGGALQTGLVLLPWVFFGGLPRLGNRREFGTPWLLGMMLPPLCLALALDLGTGVEIRDLMPLALAGAVLVALLSVAANRACGASGQPRSGRASHYAWAWLVTVPLPGLLLFVHTHGAQPAASLGEASPAAAWVAGVSPLVLIHGLTAGHGVHGVAWFLAGFSMALLLAFANLGSDRLEDARR